MSVEIELLLKLDEAEKEAERFQDEFAANVIRAADRGEEAFEKFRDKSVDELKKLAVAAKKHAEEGLKKWGDNLNEVRGIIGDVGDAVGLLGKGLFGLSESQQLVVDKTIAMTEKGMALGDSFGGLFGPIGKIAGNAIGAVGGGLLGYLAGNAEVAATEMIALNNATFAAQKIQQDLASKIRLVREQLSGVKTKGLSGDIERFDIVDAEVKAAEKKADALEKEHELLKKNLNEKIKAGSITEDELNSEKAKKAEVEAAQAEYSKLSRIQTDMVDRLRKAGDEQADKDLETFKVKGELTKKELQANKKKAEDDLQIAQNKIAYYKLELGKVEDYDAQAAGNRAKDIEEWSQAAEKARQEIQSTSDALDGFNKKASTANSKLYKEYADIFKGAFDANDLYAKNKAADEKLADEKQQRLVEEFNKQEEWNRKVEELARDYASRMANIKTKGALLANQEELNKEAAAIEAWAAKINGAIEGVGNIFKDAIGGLAVDAFNNWLDAVATGEKDADKSFKKIAASAIRNIGSQLVADGVKNILQGSADLIMGRAGGAGLIAIGGAEVAAGVGMGAAGARAQRRQGFGDDKGNGSGGSLGRNSGAKDGPIVQAPTIIQINSLTPGDKRAWQEAGHTIERARDEYRKG